MLTKDVVLQTGQWALQAMQTQPDMHTWRSISWDEHVTRIGQSLCWFEDDQLVGLLISFTLNFNPMYEDVPWPTITFIVIDNTIVYGWINRYDYGEMVGLLAQHHPHELHQQSWSFVLQGEPELVGETDIDVRIYLPENRFNAWPHGRLSPLW